MPRSAVPSRVEPVGGPASVPPEGCLIRSLAAHEWREYRDVRLHALKESPDAFGSLWELERDRPDEEWRRRVESGVRSSENLPLVAEGDSGLVGLAWGRIDPAEPETAHVYQMWVAPADRGRGLGSRLLSEIVQWARASGARRVVLDVTCGNEPAERLYWGAGFEPLGDPAPLRPGATLLSQRMSLEL